jgi:peptidoglycan-associated lipoprotein
MKHSALIVALTVAVAFVGCGKKKVETQPQPTSAAPATPPPAPAPAPKDVQQVNEYDRIKQMPIDEIDRLGLFGEIHFDFDRYDIREGDRQVLAKNAENLKKFDFIKVTIEGHCDERGSVEYNLALGERRAKAAFDYLVSLGVGADRLKSISYGKEVPLCQEHSEECWARNRRAHTTVTGKTTGR